MQADKFYSLKGTQNLEPAQWLGDSEEFLDSEEVQKKYVRKNNGVSEVYIRITNIHCSACVWLNEKVLGQQDGVHSAVINFASGRAKVQFDSDKISLKTILDTIRSIGYKPALYSPGDSNESGHAHLKSLLLRIVVAGFSFGNIMLFSVGLYAGFFSGIDLETKRLFHFVSWALATPAYLYSGAPFLQGFWNSIRKRSLTMDFLLFSGISLAYFYSIYVTITNRGEVYFDSVAMIYFFILIGKFFEEKARLLAQEKIENLLCKLPEESILLDGELEKRVLSSSLLKGDRIKILAGVRLPVDGILDTDSIHLDESFLTGESHPIPKKRGDRLLAGALALDSTLVMVAESDYQASTLSSLRIRMEEALATKPKIQLLTEKIASKFISVVFVLAILTFIGWFFFFDSGLELAMINMISVLIVACPCALGISVPTALVMNHILNAKRGVLLKNPGVIEPLSRLDHIFLDKTGTLTEGKFDVRACTIQSSYFSVIFALEKELNHPIAKSVLRYLQDFVYPGEKDFTIQRFQAIAGKGIVADVRFQSGATNKICLGNRDLLESESVSVEMESQGTIVHFSLDQNYMGSFVLQDKLREEAKDFADSLRALVPKITILSGDQSEAVQIVAQNLGIADYHSNCKPEQKRMMIQSAQENGEVVAMVGDGINDGLSLASANVAISHSEAEDLSLEKSDVVMASGNLLGILHSIRSAKKTRTVIVQNILLSFCYNSLMLPLAIFGLMLPVYCAVLMALSSLTVLGNSLSLTWRTR